MGQDDLTNLTFPDVASLLNFYKSHLLEDTSLIAIAPRHQQHYKANYDFTAQVHLPPSRRPPLR